MRKKYDSNIHRGTNTIFSKLSKSNRFCTITAAEHFCSVIVEEKLTISDITHV